MKPGSFAIALVLASVLPGAVSAQENPVSHDPEHAQVVVGTRVVPPFVILREDGSYAGLTIHLWERIAAELGLEYRYEETDIHGMIEGVAEGRYFAAASALTATSERERRVDFTHPYHVTGLGIAISHRPAGLWGSILSIFSSEFLWVLLLLVGLLLFWGALVWIFERKRNRDEFGGTAVEGIGSGLWWAAVTMTTVGYGDKSPRTLGGRVVGFVWMFAAIVVISFFTAAITSSLTVTRLDNRVNGPEDLPHVRVGVLEASATEEYLRSERVNAQAFASMEEGLLAVEADEIDAFVHDAPLIAYLIQEEFRNRVRMVPNTFNDQYYGIVLPLDSEHRNAINQVTLDIISGEDWQGWLDRYLGRFRGM